MGFGFALSRRDSSERASAWLVLDPIPVCTTLCAVKNITLSAEESLIEEARAAARAQKTTLNQMFREWLAEIAGRKDQAERLSALMHRLDYVRANGPYNRDQMNER
jgi:hypothetical protein